MIVINVVYGIYRIVYKREIPAALTLRRSRQDGRILYYIFSQFSPWHMAEYRKTIYSMGDCRLITMFIKTTHITDNTEEQNIDGEQSRRWTVVALSLIHI